MYQTGTGVQIPVYRYLRSMYATAVTVLAEIIKRPVHHPVGPPERAEQRVFVKAMRYTDRLPVVSMDREAQVSDQCYPMVNCFRPIPFVSALVHTHPHQAWVKPLACALISHEL